MKAEDLALVLAWRNHPEIRRYMFSQQEIGFEEHCRWFERASQDALRRLLIFEDKGVAQGFVHFKQTGPGGIADWGFYVAPDAPKGSGRKLGRAALDFAFGEVCYHKVCGQALDFNHASIRFHRMLGFREEGILREQFHAGDHYCDVVCFGLLCSEWTRLLSE